MNLNDLKIEWDKGYMAGDEKYRTVKCSNHPNAWPNGYVYLHRLLKELELGRILGDDEVVHHINENTEDNRLENLEILSQTEHVNHHRKLKILCVLECPQCHTEFERERRQLHKKSKMVFCSRPCNGKYYNKPR